MRGKNPQENSQGDFFESSSKDPAAKHIEKFRQMAKMWKLETDAEKDIKIRKIIKRKGNP